MSVPINASIVASRQRGAVLLVTLIALVVLLLASIALVRSVDTGNLISGNMAFREAALQNADVGIEAAFNALPDILASSKDANIANQYYALRQTLDSRSVPSGVNWSNVVCRDNTNKALTCSTQDYQVKYIIERMCDQQTAGSTVVTNVQSYCFTDVGDGKGGSLNWNSPVFSNASAIYYRVTVQVTGPRNTVSYVQAMISKG
jgi:Tfp pilus assembly protein PilX